jgi:hypothetical protein
MPNRPHGSDLLVEKLVDSLLIVCSILSKVGYDLSKVPLKGRPASLVWKWMFRHLTSPFCEVFFPSLTYIYSFFLKILVGSNQLAG